MHTNLMLSSLARALGNCLHGRVIVWSLFPLALMALLALLLSWWFWQDAVQWTLAMLQGIGWLSAGWEWLQQQGLSWGMGVFAAIVVVCFCAPAIVLVVLLLVSIFMTPLLVEWVAQRRFPTLERKHGGPWWQGVAWATGSTAVALVVLVLSIPLWLIPPLVLIVPALVWGWLTYRVMAFDVLAEHASEAERKALITRHRTSLLVMGVVCGLLGAAPSMVWVSGVVFVALFWVLIPLAIWIHALVFALSSLWFAHFCLAALEALREEQGRDGQAGQVARGAGEMGINPS